MITRVARLAAIAGAVLGVAAAAPASSQAMALGFNDVGLQTYAGTNGGKVDEAALNAGLANARRAGATEWRLMLTWRQIARGSATAPQPATLATDPAWAGYRWDDVDRLIKAVTANGLTPVVNIYAAPNWAEAADRPAGLPTPSLPAGTWRPDPVAFQYFAQALARRFNGSYPDPAVAGQVLPKVTYLHGWNEPNLATYLTPQWEKRGGKWRAASVEHFRKLTRAWARGVRTSNPKAKVLLGATAPFGGLMKTDPRIPPAAFYRELLCVAPRKGKLTGKRSCPKLDVDGWAHHTYPIGPPWRTARNVDDVVVPDMRKLTRIVNAAAASGTVRKKAAREVWMTEMSWESAPDPNGLSLSDHAFYMQGAFYTLWKAGVKHVLWWNSRDMARGSDWEATHQSGIFARGADPSQDVAKPSFTAFRFPFAAFRTKGVAQLWAQPPGGASSVIVEAADGAGWKRVATLKKQGTVYTGRLIVGPGVQLRARSGTEISYPWKTF